MYVIVGVLASVDVLIVKYTCLRVLVPFVLWGGWLVNWLAGWLVG